MYVKLPNFCEPSVSRANRSIPTTNNATVPALMATVPSNVCFVMVTNTVSSRPETLRFTVLGEDVRFGLGGGCGLWEILECLEPAVFVKSVDGNEDISVRAGDIEGT